MREEFLDTVRPAARFQEREEGDGPVARRLGGIPDLPDDAAWPAWEGHGELTHLGTLDCALVPRGLSPACPARAPWCFSSLSKRSWWHSGYEPIFFEATNVAAPDSVDMRSGTKLLYISASAPPRLTITAGGHDAEASTG